MKGKRRNRRYHNKKLEFNKFIVNSMFNFEPKNKIYRFKRIRIRQFMNTLESGKYEKYARSIIINDISEHKYYLFSYKGNSAFVSKAYYLFDDAICLNSQKLDDNSMINMMVFEKDGKRFLSCSKHYFASEFNSATITHEIDEDGMPVLYYYQDVYGEKMLLDKRDKK